LLRRKVSNQKTLVVPLKVKDKLTAERKMELLGRVWKSNKYWLIEVPSLDLATQGRSRKEALEMMRDAILELVKSYFGLCKSFDVMINDHKKGIIGAMATNSIPLLALLLKRQSEQSNLLSAMLQNLSYF
jgi:hypothetical protein